MTDRPTPPGYWLPDDIWQLINERLNETGEPMSKVIAEFKRRYEVQIGRRYYLPLSRQEFRLEWVFDKAFSSVEDALAYAIDRSEEEADVRVVDNEDANEENNRWLMYR